MIRVVLLLLALATSASAQTYTGRLEPGDGTLNSGEFRDEYRVQARAGETVRAVVTSDAFDTYIILKTASGAQAEDDDCTDGESGRSCVSLAADVDGPVRVLVTSFAVGETGRYQVRVSVGAEDGARRDTTTGALDADDLTLASGEYADRHDVAVRAGQRLAVDLASEAFVPYLIVRGPDDEQVEAASCADAAPGRACVTVDVATDGIWQVFATSTGAAQTGRYALSIDTDAPAAHASRDRSP